MGGFVLIVDDDPDIRASLTSGLEFRGFRVVAAENGREALRVIDRELPTLVLLDIEMPVMDGRELASVLEKRGTRLPIIVMSGAAEAGLIAKETGAVACLIKPFDLKRLFASIDAVINSTS